MSIISANINNLIQVHIPQRSSGDSFVFKMKCEVTSNTTHEVLISKQIGYRSYKEICGGERKTITLGYNNWYGILKVENKTLLPYPKKSFIFGEEPSMSHPWEVLSKFFSLHNVKPNWLHCGQRWGWYDKNQGAWTGCMGKVR